MLSLIHIYQADHGAAQGVDQVQPRQLQHQVHSPDQQLQQDRQSHEGDQEQRRIENGLGQTLHHGHDQGYAGVLDLLRRLAEMCIRDRSWTTPSP